MKRFVFVYRGTGGNGGSRGSRESRGRGGREGGMDRGGVFLRFHLDWPEPDGSGVEPDVGLEEDGRAQKQMALGGSHHVHSVSSSG